MHNTSRSAGGISDSGLLVFGNSTGNGNGQNVRSSLASPNSSSGGGVVGENTGSVKGSGPPGLPLASTVAFPAVLPSSNAVDNSYSLHNRPSAPSSIPRHGHSASFTGGGVGKGGSATHGEGYSHAPSLNSWEQGGLNRFSRPVTRPAASIPVRNEGNGLERPPSALGVPLQNDDFFDPTEAMRSNGPGVASDGSVMNGLNPSSNQSFADQRFLSSNFPDGGGSIGKDTAMTDPLYTVGGYHPPLPNASKSYAGEMGNASGEGTEGYFAPPSQGGPFRGEPTSQFQSGGLRGPPLHGSRTIPPQSGPNSMKGVPHMWSTTTPQPGQEHMFPHAPSSAPPSSFGRPGSSNLSSFGSDAAPSPIENGSPLLSGSAKKSASSVVLNSAKNFFWSATLGNDPSASAATPLPLYQTRFGCPEDDLPLLQELGVDVQIIFQKTWSVLNVFSTPTEALSSSHDLSGPIVFAVAIALLLLLQGKVEFSAVYGLMITGVLLLRFILPLMSGTSISMVLVTSALGYGLLPCVLLAFVYAVQFWVFGHWRSSSFLLPAVILFVLWSAWSASSFIAFDLHLKHQRYLIFYPCVLFYALFAALTVI